MSSKKSPEEENTEPAWVPYPALCHPQSSEYMCFIQIIDFYPCSHTGFYVVTQLMMLTTATPQVWYLSSHHPFLTLWLCLESDCYLAASQLSNQNEEPKCPPRGPVPS